MRYVPCIGILLFLAITVLMLSGCNTINGIGKDLQSWTADETHGHHMAEDQRRKQKYQN